MFDATNDLRAQVAGPGVTTSQLPQPPHAMPLPLSPRTLPLRASEIDRAYPVPLWEPSLLPTALDSAANVVKPGCDNE